MKKEEIHDFAIEMIATYTKTDYELIREAYERPTFYLKKFPKKSGGVRILHKPTGITKRVVKAVYDNIFQKFYSLGIISKHCCGCIKNKSVMDGIYPHTLLVPNFLIDIDLKDAFHSVSKKQIVNILQNIFLAEINYHRRLYYYHHENNLKKLEILNNFKETDDFKINGLNKKQTFKKRMEVKEKWSDQNIYHNIDNKYQPLYQNKKRILLFPNKNYPYLKKLISEPVHFNDIKMICVEMAEILSTIITCEGIMPQGYNTSPILMALALSQDNIINIFKDVFLNDKIPPSFINNGFDGISIYVDSLTISIYDENTNKSMLTEKLLSIIKKIENTSLWRFNYKKLHIYDCRVENPMVTGLRLKKKKLHRGELKSLRDKRIKGARKYLRDNTPWYAFEPTIPKAKQKTIRAIFHKAAKIEISDNKLFLKALGYVSYIRHIYKNGKIPKQIFLPMEKFLASEKIKNM